MVLRVPGFSGPDPLGRFHPLAAARGVISNSSANRWARSTSSREGLLRCTRSAGCCNTSSKAWFTKPGSRAGTLQVGGVVHAQQGLLHQAPGVGVHPAAAVGAFGAAGCHGVRLWRVGGGGAGVGRCPPSRRGRLRGAPAAGCWSRMPIRDNTEDASAGSCVLSKNRNWRALATVMNDVESLSGPTGRVPRPRLPDHQGWSTLAAGTLLLLISFTTNYGNDNLLRFRRLPAHDQVGVCLHLAALAALAGDAELASRLRHRARNQEAADRITREREAVAREREAVEAVTRERRQNRALRAGALFLLDPNPLHRRFLAYIASELAGPPPSDEAS
jgi:hypothetical protein